MPNNLITVFSGLREIPDLTQEEFSKELIMDDFDFDDVFMDLDFDGEDEIQRSRLPERTTGRLASPLRLEPHCLANEILKGSETIDMAPKRLRDSLSWMLEEYNRRGFKPIDDGVSLNYLPFGISGFIG